MLRINKRSWIVFALTVVLAIAFQTAAQEKSSGEEKAKDNESGKAKKAVQAEEKLDKPHTTPDYQKQVKQYGFDDLERKVLDNSINIIRENVKNAKYNLDMYTESSRVVGENIKSVEKADNYLDGENDKQTTYVQKAEGTLSDIAKDKGELDTQEKDNQKNLSSDRETLAKLEAMLRQIKENIAVREKNTQNYKKLTADLETKKGIWEKNKAVAVRAIADIGNLLKELAAKAVQLKEKKTEMDQNAQKWNDVFKTQSELLEKQKALKEK